MEKKRYIKPSVKVYEFEQKPRLLVGSDYDRGLGYVPGINDADKHLA